jgi:peptidoglycan/xylan/chitin deacetylase (PgdA/CDA1 family)
LADHGRIDQARHPCVPTVNSDVCVHHPEIIQECVRLGWELVGHNKKNSERLNAVPVEEERALIKNALATLERASGRRPVGWLGSALAETWNTLDHLIDEGCLYVADWVNDDQPYLMDVGGRRIVSIPIPTSSTIRRTSTTASVAPTSSSA